MTISNTNKTGFSLVDDFMIDIMGALFPGFLFLALFFVGTLVPVWMIYHEDFELLLKDVEISGSLWWILLIVMLIISYIIGHIFFRADILNPDKADIIRRIEEEIEKSKDLYTSFTDEDALRCDIRKRIQGLEEALKKYLDTPKNQNGQSKTSYDVYVILHKHCEEALKANCYGNYMEAIYLGILFPEEVARHNSDEMGIQRDELPLKVQEIIDRIEGKISRSSVIGRNEDRLSLVVFLCILNIQCEVGCLSNEGCSFPYLYYYKYLLKRNLPEYLRLVTWNTYDGRSKNVINYYKTRIQLFAPEGYAVIRKNESHIRMSSSTWYLIQPLKWIMGFVLILLVVAFVWKCDGKEAGLWGMAIFPPLLIFIFLFYIQNGIIHYIHYQRMREVFHAICIYDEYEDIIRCRKQNERWYSR